MNFTDLLQHEDIFVVGLTAKAIRYKKEREEGDLSVEEYNHLCQQLVDMRNLGLTADEMDQKQYLAEALQVISKFLGVII